jgi:hypothetical protein
MSPDRDTHDVTILKDAHLPAVMEERHILDEDMKQVIAHAEATGEKLYQEGSERYLAKLKTENATFYVEYSRSGDAYRVHSAYFHRSEIME